MHFAIACILSILTICVRVPFSFASPATTSNFGADGLSASNFSKNITRTISGESISLIADCSMTDRYCQQWCKELPVIKTTMAACENDCDDDYCRHFVDKIEFPKNSGQFVLPSELVVRAREEKLAQMHTAYANSHSLQRRDLAACLASCRTFAQFAGYIPYRLFRAVASGLAHTACPAICYSTFGPVP